jgi:hypothetical protein
MIRYKLPHRYIVASVTASVFAISFLAGSMHATQVQADNSCPACNVTPQTTSFIYTPSCQGLSSVYYVLFRVAPNTGTGLGTRATACLYANLTNSAFAHFPEPKAELAAVLKGRSS